MGEPKKISELNNGGDVLDTDEFLALRGSTNVRLSGKKLKEKLASAEKGTALLDVSEEEFRAGDTASVSEGTSLYQTIHGDLFKETKAENDRFDFMNGIGAKFNFVPTERGFGSLANASYEDHTASATSPKVVTSFGGKLYGYWGLELFEKISKESNWVKSCDIPHAPAVHLEPMNDREVVLVTSDRIYKSSGWGTGTVSWIEKVDNFEEGSVYLGYSSAGCDGTNMIVAEYGTPLPGAPVADYWTESTHAWATQDGGNTWSVVFNSEVMFPANPAASHLHGACYDKWQKLWFVIEGHDVQMGIYYSADPFADPTDWTRIEKGLLGATRTEGQPTCIVPTSKGLICASDATQAGAWIVERGNSPEDMTVEWLWELPGGRGITLAFGQCWAIDKRTDTVYFGMHFNGGTPASVLSIVAANGKHGGGRVWHGASDTAPPVGQANDVMNIVVTPWGELIAQTTASSYVGPKEIRGQVTTGNLGANWIQDPGGSLGGLVEDPTSRSLSLSAGCKVKGNDSVGAGMGSEIDGNSNCLYGNNSKIIGANTVLFGSYSSAKSNCLAIGYGLVLDNNQVVISSNKDVSGIPVPLTIIGTPTVVSVGGFYAGNGGKLEGLGSTVLGRYSSSGPGGIYGGALMENSHVNHAGSVVLCANETSSAPNQVLVGNKNLTFKEMTAHPSNTQVGEGMFYLFDGAIWFKGPTGDEQFVAGNQTPAGQQNETIGSGTAWQEAVTLNPGTTHLIIDGPATTGLSRINGGVAGQQLTVTINNPTYIVHTGTQNLDYNLSSGALAQGPVTYDMTLSGSTHLWEPTV